MVLTTKKEGKPAEKLLVKEPRKAQSCTPTPVTITVLKRSRSDQELQRNSQLRYFKGQ